MALALISLVVLIVQSRRPHPPEALYVNRVAEDGDLEGRGIGRVTAEGVLSRQAAIAALHIDV